MHSVAAAPFNEYASSVFYTATGAPLGPYVGTRNFPISSGAWGFRSRGARTSSPRSRAAAQRSVSLVIRPFLRSGGSTANGKGAGAHVLVSPPNRYVGPDPQSLQPPVALSHLSDHQTVDRCPSSAAIRRVGDAGISSRDRRPLLSIPNKGSISPNRRGGGPSPKVSQQRFAAHAGMAAPTPSNFARGDAPRVSFRPGPRR